VRHRYRIVVRHYRELAEREEQVDNARMTISVGHDELQLKRMARH